MEADQRSQWRRADEVFAALIELDDAARAAALKRLDLAPSVRAKVDVLLANTHRSHVLLDAAQPQDVLWHATDRGAPGEQDASEADDDPLLGRCIGEWRLLELLGRGGMAAVYRARRIGQDYHHEAAVKLLGLTLRGASDQRRFRREQRILASLQHPHIASLIDGGVADDGTPYLVMGLVSGQRIDRYCDARELALRERVKLVLQVCSAAAYAHHKLVVHRDIKPGNILVNGAGHATLLDFGIAHLLDDEASGERTMTRAFTPAYCAPEQRHGERDVGTAVDVYGLGAVLHRLATGVPPQSQANDQATLPSKVAEGNDRPREAAALRGDLDAIVLHALEVQPSERYAGVGALTADLEAWLEHRPVAARRAGPTKRLGKLVRRNRVASAAVVLALVALAAGITTIAVSRSTLEKRAEVLQSVVAFQSGMLQRVDPQQVGEHLRRAMNKALKAGSALTATQRKAALAKVDFTGTAAQMLDRAVLARAVAESRTRFTSQPKVLAMMLQSLGASYRDLSEYDKAGALLAEATSLFRKTLGPGDRRTLASMRDYATRFAYVDEDEQGKAFANRMLALHRQYLGDDDPDTALAEVIGIMASGVTDVAAAEGQLRHARPLVAARYGRVSAETNMVLANLASLATQQGHFQQAADVLRDALAVSIKLYGAESGAVIDLRSKLVWLRDPHGHSARNHEDYMELLAISTRKFGEYHPRTLGLLDRAAAWPRLQGNYAAAEPMQRRVYEGFVQTFGRSHYQTFQSQVRLAEIELHLGKRQQAKALLMDALPRVKASQWSFFTPKIQFLMGQVATQSNAYPQAESWLLKAWDGAVEHGFSGRQHDTARALVALYAAWHQADKHAQWQARLQQLDTEAADH